MTDDTLARRAALVVDLRAAVSLGRPLTHAEVDEIEAALRLPAGEGWVLVPREPTEAMRRVLYQMLAEGHTVDESYDELIAAAPRHETGEGL